LRKKNFYEEKVEKSDEELADEHEALKKQWETEAKEFTDEDIENAVNRTTTKQAWNYKFERLNENKPLWLKNKAEVSKSEYREFYKNVFKDTSDPLTWTHFKAEGDVDFTGLMYIPERAPYDQFEKFYEKKNEVKLFVRRVLVNDKFEEMLPKYLNFIKAIVDSDNLPLNVDR
jgi:heat shock protein beta